MQPLRYLHYVPELAVPHEIAPTAVVIGRTVAGPGLVVRGYATIRADGEWIRIGANAFFGERATVHIADGMIPTRIGDDVAVGAYALVHACTLGDGVVVAEGATVMDGASVGAYALVAPGALVSPRKQFDGGFVYAGNPAQPVRTIARDELAAIAARVRRGEPADADATVPLPPADMTQYVPRGAGGGPLYAFDGRAPKLARSLAAPTSALVGDVELADDAGVFFGCAVVANGATIAIGAESNIQDNSILATDRTRGDLTIGKRVTFGHNVRMGSGTIGDEALVGMSSTVGDNVVVEPGGVIAAGAYVEPRTRVKSGWIWAGRPAREFRPLKAAERAGFDTIIGVYVAYATDYRAP